MYSEHQLWDDKLSQAFDAKHTTEFPDLIMRTPEETPLLEILQASGLRVIGESGPFLLTCNTIGATRYWYQFPYGRCTSYFGAKEHAYKLLEEETKIMEKIVEIGGTAIERNNHQYQTAKYVSFQYNRKCTKCLIQTGKPITLDYCSGLPV